MPGTFLYTLDTYMLATAMTWAFTMYNFHNFTEIMLQILYSLLDETELVIRVPFWLN